MGKNKLQKFAELNEMPHVFQCPRMGQADTQPFALRGAWHTFFKNNNPIVLELGCGRGEYTVGLAARWSNKNFIGVDIKGARLWTGAKQALEQNLSNVAFLRTNIEMIGSFFAPGEVSEIWITFPDPQMKKVRKRLTATNFMQMYCQIMQAGGKIHLKTDSPFLYTYTRLMTQYNQLPLLCDTDDLYHKPAGGEDLNIRTYYEQQWLDRGLSIKYLQFKLEERTTWTEPTETIEPDSYRSYNRSRRGPNNTPIQ